MKTKYQIIRNLALVLVATLLFTGCKKDSTSSSDIVGTWTTGTPTFTVTVGDKTLEQYFVDVAGLTATEAAQYTALFNLMLQQQFTGSIVIKDDGTYSATLGGSPETGTWTLSSDNKTLTITPTGSDPVIVNVISLTSSQMHAQINETIQQDLNGDNVDETVSISLDMTFTKS